MLVTSVVWTVGSSMSTKSLESFVYAPWSFNRKRSKKKWCSGRPRVYLPTLGLFGQISKGLFSRCGLWINLQAVSDPILWGMGCLDRQILGIFERGLHSEPPFLGDSVPRFTQTWMSQKSYEMLRKWVNFTPTTPYLIRIGEIFQQPIGSDHFSHWIRSLPTRDPSRDISLNSCRCWGA